MKARIVSERRFARIKEAEKAAAEAREIAEYVLQQLHSTQTVLRWQLLPWWKRLWLTFKNWRQARRNRRVLEALP